MSDYLKIDDAKPDVPDLEVDDEEKYDDNSFLSQVRRTRNDAIKNAKVHAEEGAKKYLSMPVYNDVKLLYSDVDKIMRCIKNNAPDKNMIYIVLKLSDESWLGGLRKLFVIYNDFKLDKHLINNTIFMDKFWKFVNDAVEIFVAALTEKTGIPRQNELPFKAKNSKYLHEPSEGICLKNAKSYELYVWW